MGRLREVVAKIYRKVKKYKAIDVAIKVVFFPYFLIRRTRLIQRSMESQQQVIVNQQEEIQRLLRRLHDIDNNLNPYFDHGIIRKIRLKIEDLEVKPHYESIGLPRIGDRRSYMERVVKAKKICRKN